MDYFERNHHGSFWRQRGNQPLMYRRRLGFIQKHAKGRRLLDVGSGEGHFAKLAQDRGWRVFAMDFLPEGVRRTHERLGAVVVRGDAQVLPFKANSFDVVALWDVLEHLARPDYGLQEVRRVLVPGGLLAWTTPNTAARSVATKGSAASQFQDETHISLWSRAAWEHALAGAGFSQVLLGTDAHWDIPYPGSRVPRLAQHVTVQARYALRYASPKLIDGENLVGLHRCV